MATVGVDSPFGCGAITANLAASPQLFVTSPNVVAAGITKTGVGDYLFPISWGPGQVGQQHGTCMIIPVVDSTDVAVDATHWAEVDIKTTVDGNGIINGVRVLIWTVVAPLGVVTRTAADLNGCGFLVVTLNQL